MSPYNKTLLSVIFDHKDNGIFWAVRGADKLIKAHCLPLEWKLKRSLPWWKSAERNKAIVISENARFVKSLEKLKHTSWKL